MENDSKRCTHKCLSSALQHNMEKEGETVTMYIFSRNALYGVDLAVEPIRLVKL
jgi:hypothetical protein